MTHTLSLWRNMTPYDIYGIIAVQSISLDGGLVYHDPLVRAHVDV